MGTVIKKINVVDNAMKNPSNPVPGWWSRDAGPDRVLMRYNHTMMAWNRETKYVILKWFETRTDYEGVRYAFYKITGLKLNKDGTTEAVARPLL